MPVYVAQANFVRGEASPKLHGRSDIDNYLMSLAVARNWIVLPQGGITRRPGSRYIAGVKNQTSSDPPRLIRFEFSEEQAYAIEMGNLYLRFYTLGGQVESGGSPYEIVSPYAIADVWGIQYTQSGDTIYLAHPDYAPRTLVRTSETSWTISTFSPLDGPYLEENITSTRLTPANRGAINPKMSDNTTPSGTAASDTGSVDAYKVFDFESSTTYSPAGTSGWVSYNPGSSMVADAYWLVAPADAGAVDGMITTWEFEGYDGSNWVTLDSRVNESGWRTSERRYFEFVNTTAYQAYRVSWSSVDGGGSTHIAGINIHRAATDQTAFNLTASSTTGINGGSGFASSDVGRPIRLYGSDAKWRWAKIITRTSSTVVTVQLYGHALQDVSPISRWAMGAWSETTGWPRAVAFFEERLAFAATTSEPAKIWLSKPQDFDDFGYSEPLQADDGIVVEMTGGRLNKIAWIEEVGDLGIATAGDTRVLGQSDAADPFSATNARQKRQNSYGAGAVQPVNVGSIVVYTDRYRKHLLEFGYDAGTGRYGALERSIFSDHLFSGGVKDLTFQQDPNGLLWSVMDNGRLPCTTYVPSQEVYGMTDCRIAGAFGTTTHGIVESAVSIPSAGGDVLYLIVKRTINGATTRYVEYIEGFYEDGDDIEEACYLDAALSYSGSATNSVSGASHLEGQTVGIWADGQDIGDAVVTSGVVTLPNSIEASKITIGLRYQSYAKTLRLTQAGQKDGALLGRRVNVSGITVDLLNSVYLEVGSQSSNDQNIVGRYFTDPMDEPMVVRSGALELSGVYDSWKNEGVVVMKSSHCGPATVRALSVRVESEP